MAYGQDADEDFVAFVRDASPRLLNAAWFICGDPVSAEDLVQAAFEKVYVRWPRLRDEDGALAYARRCVLTTHIDIRRRRAKESLTDSVPEGAWNDQPPQDTTALLALLAHLSPRERQCVVMRHYLNLPESEVAEMLNVSVGTVKSCTSRGLARVRNNAGTEVADRVR